MYKCDICGRESFKKIRAYGHTLCSKHMHQFVKYGHALDNNPRTVNDLNDYIIQGDYVYFNVYNQRCDWVGYFVIDLCDIELVKYHKWRFNSFGHVVTGSGKGNIRDVSHVVLGIDKSLDSEIIVDYVNGNPRDNRRINLKICTHSQNHLSNNSTGIIGVSYDKNRHVYAPEIRIGKKRVHLGRYRSIEEAAYVRLVAEKDLFKEFVNDNDDIRKKENMSTTISQVRQDELYDYTISKIQAHFGN